MADDWVGDAFRAKRARRYGVSPDPEPEPEAEPFPDLGQGARGLNTSPDGPSMSDLIRGERHAHRALADQESKAEFGFRTAAEKAP